MSEYLDNLLECPFCSTIRLRIPKDAEPATIIRCDDCGHVLGTWDEIQASFEEQGGQDGVFRLARGKIERLD
ncbi:hypothetical protein AB4144_45840 [Rhizobiaceae sp. 2RAB30]